MRPSRLSGFYLCLLLIGLALLASPASAATLTASATSVTICTTSGTQSSSVSITGYSGSLTAALSNESPAGVFYDNIQGGTVNIGIHQGVAATATLTITDSANNSVAISLTSGTGGNCTSTGGGTGTISVSPASLTFTQAVGSFANAQGLTLTAPAGTSYSVTANSGTCAVGWLQTSPVSGSNNTTPAATTSITVFATSTTNTAGTTCSGSVVIVAGSTTLTVPVSLSVGIAGTGGVTASPTVMSFANGLAQGLTITDYAATSYTVVSNQTWLLVNGVTYTGGSMSGSIVLQVSVNTTNLTAGQAYSGSLLITTAEPGNTAGGSVTVPVSYNSTGTNGSGLSVTPSTLSFSSPAGSTALTGVQYLTLSSTVGGTSTFTVSPTVGWLLLSQSTGSLPGTIAVYANPAAATQGTTVTGYINISTTGALITTQSILVTFAVGGGGGSTTGGQVAPASLTFAYQTGVSLPVPPQTLLVTGIVGYSYTTSVSLTSGSGWLSVSPSSGTFSSTSPTPLTVSITNLAMGVGTYTGSITVNGSSGTQIIPITLNVTSGPVLIANPGSWDATVQAGATTASVPNLALTSSSGSLTYSITPLVSWLSVTSVSTTTTPAYLGINVNPSGLPAGLNTGTLSISAPGAANSPLSIPVVVAVVGGVAISPTSLSFSTLPGSSPAAQSLSVSASIATAFTATASSNSNWLTVSPNSATTPASITVYVNSSSLPAATYTGNIVISAGGGTQNIPVTLTVSTSGTSGTVTLSPTTLSFTSPGSTLTQGVQVSSASGTNPTFSTQVSYGSGTGWLSVSPTSGTAPTTLGVTVNPNGLADGTYQGTVTVSPTGGSAQTVSVTFTVQGQSSLTVGSNSLTFNYRTGDSAPAAQTVAVGSSGSALAFTATAASNGNWLSVSPASGNSPATLSVSVNPSGLTAGTTPYTGTITVAGTSGGGTQTINVSLKVTAPLPTVSSVVNGASYVGGNVAPGEVVTLFGTSIGPNTQTTLTLDNTGKVATTLGGVQVLFSGFTAPLIFVSDTQVSAVVPYEVAGRVSTTVQVKYQGATSNILTVPVSTTAPGIFTLNASGSGPGAIVNQDGTVNSSGSPASAGSIVLLYVTGEGQTSPGGSDGAVTTPPTLPVPVLPVAVLIGGQPASILYAGEAPGIVSGVMQVNVRIPSGIPSGTASVVVSVGGANSQNNVTVAVK